MLTARGETTNNLVSNLFKGYQTTKCAKFRNYMDRKKEGFRDGSVDYTVKFLMITAENKFNDLKLDGDWEALTENEKTILALRAQMMTTENIMSSSSQTQSLFPKAPCLSAYYRPNTLVKRTSSAESTLMTRAQLISPPESKMYCHGLTSLIA
jgi:hypothetical protein